MEVFYSASVYLRSSVVGGVLDYADISKVTGDYCCTR